MEGEWEREGGRGRGGQGEGERVYVVEREGERGEGWKGRERERLITTIYHHVYYILCRCHQNVETDEAPLKAIKELL